MSCMPYYRSQVWRLLFIWFLITIPPSAFAQLDCNAPPEGFATGIPIGWSGNSTNGVAWDDLTSCGEADNFTGAAGDAACASSDHHGSGAFSAELRSPLFDLTGVTLSPPSSRVVEVDYATAGTTGAGAGAGAGAGTDYLATTGTLVFQPGVTHQTLAVQILGERLDELDETFLVRLTNPVAAKLLDGEGLGTIIDDDDAEMSISDGTVVEADTDPVQALFSVTMSAISDRAVTVDYATADGTATAGSDYAPRSGTLTVPAGAGEQTLSIEVIGDQLDEEAESFTVALSNPGQALLADAVGTCTITDNDTLEISVDDAPAVGEQDAGNIDVVFTVSLSLVNLEPVTVDYATVSDTAVGGVDYQPVSGAGTIESEDPIHVTVGEVAIGEAVAIGFDVAIDNPLAGDVEILNQGIVTSVELPDLITDDPDLPGEQDPTVTLSVGCEYGLEVEFAEGCDTVFIPATCGDCDGKVTELTLEYLGDQTDAWVEVVQKKDQVVVFEGLVQPGEQFGFIGTDGGGDRQTGTLSTEITIWVDGVENTRMHTSCSEPIGPGLVSGDFLVIDGQSRNGGPLCSLVDLGCGECDMPSAPHNTNIFWSRSDKGV